MLQNSIPPLLAVLFMLSSVPAAAQVTARAQLSDIGAGVEIGYRWDQQWGLRLGFLRGELDIDFDAENNNGMEGDELDYDSDVDLENSYLLADWHPWNGRFRVSFGSFFNNSEATVITRCNNEALVPGTESCEFGNSRFSPTLLGEITTEVDFDTVAPYLGIGWGHQAKSGFALNADLGVAYIGSAHVDIRSSGSCNDNAECRRQVNEEEKEVEEELDKFRFLPIVSLGVSYRF